MPSPKIVVVVPTCRPESHAKFVEAWRPLFEKHRVTLVTVWDGESPSLSHDEFWDGGIHDRLDEAMEHCPRMYNCSPDLFCRHTDACRNLGFVVAAPLLTSPDDVVLTLDDDVIPCTQIPRGDKTGVYNDPIAAHLDALSRRVPLSWMNTAHDTDLYLRGVPYGVRTEAPVMLSHGVWVGVPDFDGQTQLQLEEGECTTPLCGAFNYKNGVCEECGAAQRPVGLPHSLPYYVGPVPRGVLFPLCGMNVMVKRDALPYLYYAPMGVDSGVVCPNCFGERGVPDVPGFKCAGCRGTGSLLHRFADIFMGVFLKRAFDNLGWACVTGYSTIHHTRASDARKNYEQEKLGREWMEQLADLHSGSCPDEGFSEQFRRYFDSYADKRTRYAELITSLLQVKK